jgi:hypothetical protein
MLCSTPKRINPSTVTVSGARVANASDTPATASMPVTSNRAGGRLVDVFWLRSALSWWYGFPLAFALTCVIEVPVYLGAFVMLGWCGRGRRPDRSLSLLTGLGLALAVNLITHPLLWWLSLDFDGPQQLIIAEAAVALVEGLVIFAVVRHRRGTDSLVNRFGWSMMIAFGVNALSLLIGLLIMPSPGRPA